MARSKAHVHGTVHAHVDGTYPARRVISALALHPYSSRDLQTSKIFMTLIMIAHIVIAHIVMIHIVLAYVIMALHP